MHVRVQSGGWGGAYVVPSYASDLELEGPEVSWEGSERLVVQPSDLRHTQGNRGSTFNPRRHPGKLVPLLSL